MVEATVATQFETIAAAAAGCDVIVGATALQIAASLGGGEAGHPLRLRRLLPDRAAIAAPRAASTAAPGRDAAARDGRQSRALGAGCASGCNDLFGAALNSHRASLGLAPVSDVRGYIFTDRPWLAADPTLAPWPDPADQSRVSDRRLDPAG